MHHIREWQNLETKKQVQKPLQKRKFKLEIKPVIGNLPDEQYQLGSEYAKGAHLNANIILGLEDLKLKASRLI